MIINTKEFSELYDLASKTNLINQPILVDFFAKWCNPCKTLSPILDEIANEIPEIKVVKIDVEDETELCNSFKIKNLPTLIFIHKDGSISTTVGLTNKQTLIDKINSFMLQCGS